MSINGRVKRVAITGRQQGEGPHDSQEVQLVHELDKLDEIAFGPIEDKRASHGFMHGPQYVRIDGIAAKVLLLAHKTQDNETNE